MEREEARHILKPSSVVRPTLDPRRDAEDDTRDACATPHTPFAGDEQLLTPPKAPLSQEGGAFACSAQTASADRGLESGRGAGIVHRMSTLAEIEEAIETLPASEMETLAAWLERRRATKRVATPDKREAVAAFLRRWMGAGIPVEDADLEALRTARLMEKHGK